MAITQTAALLRRMNGEYDNAIEDIDGFMDRQAHGENEDESEFVKLLQKRQVVQDTLEAVTKFDTKTAKTVLNEAK